MDPDTAVTALSPIVRPTMRPFYVLEHDEIFPSSDSEPDVEEYLDASNTTPIPPKESESEDSESDAVCSIDYYFTRVHSLKLYFFNICFRKA